MNPYAPDRMRCTTSSVTSARSSRFQVVSGQSRATGPARGPPAERRLLAAVEKDVTWRISRSRRCAAAALRERSALRPGYASGGPVDMPRAAPTSHRRWSDRRTRRDGEETTAEPSKAGSVRARVISARGPNEIAEDHHVAVLHRADRRAVLILQENRGKHDSSVRWCS